MNIITRVRKAITKFWVGNINLATQLFRLHSSRWGSILGEEITDPYSQNPWVARAARLTANSISQVPTPIEMGDLKAPVLVTDKAVNTLFDDPNPYMTRAQLWKVTDLLLNLSGNCLWIMPGRENVAMLPKELWPVPRDNWKPWVDKETRMIQAWENLSESDEKTRFLPYWQVLHFKEDDPRGGMWGLSKLSSALLAINSDFKAQKAAGRAFDNDATPGGVIEVPESYGEMTDDKYQQLKTMWEARHQGTSNASRIAFLEGGMKFTAVAADLARLESTANRQMTREDVAAAFDIPPELIGLGNVTLANRNEAIKALWEQNLTPRTNYLAEMVTERILQPVSGGRWRIRFDTTNIQALQANLTEKMGQAAIMHGNGIPWTEINRRLDLKLERFPGDDQAFIPFNLQPFGTDTETGEPPAALEPPDQPPKLPAPVPVPIPPPVDPSTLIPMYQTAGTSAMHKAMLNQRWKLYEKAVLLPNEKRFRGRMEKFFTEQAGAQVARLHQIAGEDRAGKVPEVKDGPPSLSPNLIEEVLIKQDEWDAILRKRARPIYQSVFEDAGDDLEKLADLVFNPESPVYAKFLEKKNQRFAADVNKTTLDKIRKTLVEGSTAGETIQQMADRIYAVFDDNRSRALTIARTEVAQAANGTRFLVMKENGVDQHEWTTAGDGEVRPSHAAENGNIVDIGKKFPVTGLEYPGQWDGPPDETVNCRCVASPVIKAP